MHRKDKDGLTKSNLILKVTTQNQINKKPKQTNQKQKNIFKIIKNYMQKKLTLSTKTKSLDWLWHYNYVLLVQHSSHLRYDWTDWIEFYSAYFVRSFVRLFNCSIVRLFVDHVCLILMFVRAFCKFSKTAFLIYILIDWYTYYICSSFDAYQNLWWKEYKKKKMKTMHNNKEKFALIFLICIQTSVASKICFNALHHVLNIV